LQNSPFIAPQLAHHNRTADRSRNLTLASLNQRTHPLLVPTPSMISLQTTFTDATAPGVPIALLQPLTLGRIFFNTLNLCPNASRYRDNTHTFHDLTRRVVAPRPTRTWACTHCGTELSRVDQPLAPPPAPAADRLWVDAAGMLQAHRESGGWACIWPIKDAGACGEPFAGERALLGHMRRWHVEVRGVGQARAAAVDWPADGVRRVARKCGFGVEIGGREMREGRNGFLVPAAGRP
jgi:hypothetical protein